MNENPGVVYGLSVGIGIIATLGYLDVRRAKQNVPKWERRKIVKGTKRANVWQFLCAVSLMAWPLYLLHIHADVYPYLWFFGCAGIAGGYHVVRFYI